MKTHKILLLIIEITINSYHHLKLTMHIRNIKVFLLEMELRKPWKVMCQVKPCTSKPFIIVKAYLQRTLIYKLLWNKRSVPIKWFKKTKAQIKEGKR
jgi:hypothetical protein